jgi:hypothetical protein
MQISACNALLGSTNKLHSPINKPSKIPWMGAPATYPTDIQNKTSADNREDI